MGACRQFQGHDSVYLAYNGNFHVDIYTQRNLGLLSYLSSAPPAVKGSYEGEQHYHHFAHCG